MDDVRTPPPIPLDPRLRLVSVALVAVSALALLNSLSYIDVMVRYGFGFDHHSAIYSLCLAVNAAGIAVGAGVLAGAPWGRRVGNWVALVGALTYLDPVLFLILRLRVLGPNSVPFNSMPEFALNIANFVTYVAFFCLSLRSPPAVPRSSA
jgi:hypothetical protein